MKALLLGSLVIGAIGVSAMLDGESGLSNWLRLRRDLEVSNLRVAQLERENAALQGEIGILEDEPAAIDRAIREELDLVLPGEIVVRFESAAGPAGQRAGVKASVADRSWDRGAQVDQDFVDFGEEASREESVPSVSGGPPDAAPAESADAWADDAPAMIDDVEESGATR